MFLSSILLARRFNSYEDIVDACSIAWNDFVSDTQRVIQMCHRDWLNMPNHSIKTEWYYMGLFRHTVVDNDSF
jgi:hypothetical protein